MSRLARKRAAQKAGSTTTTTGQNRQIGQFYEIKQSVRLVGTLPDARYPGAHAVVVSGPIGKNPCCYRIALTKTFPNVHYMTVPSYDLRAI